MSSYFFPFIFILPVLCTLFFADAAGAADAQNSSAADSLFPVTEEAEKKEKGDNKSDSLVVKSVLLLALNKVTTRSEKIEAPIGALVRFGNLEIVALACHKSAPEEQPENSSLLDIWELKPGESPQRIFRGWMFSSSPSLSSLQHPVYDLTVLQCRETTMEEPG